MKICSRVWIFVPPFPSLSHEERITERKSERESRSSQGLEIRANVSRPFEKKKNNLRKGWLSSRSVVSSKNTRGRQAGRQAQLSSLRDVDLNKLSSSLVVRRIPKNLVIFLFSLLFFSFFFPFTGAVLIRSAWPARLYLRRLTVAISVVASVPPLVRNF